MINLRYIPSLVRVVKHVWSSEWNEVYETTALKELPWHSEEPADYLVELVKKKMVKGPVLDICCGAGTNSVYLAKKGFEVHGIDISEKAIELAKERAKKEGVKCNFIVGNASGLPYPDNKFSFIFDRGCLHHIPKELKKKFVDDIVRVLKKGGKYQLNCFSDKDHYFDGLSKEDIKNYFSKDFDMKSIKDIKFKEKTGLNRYFYSVLMVRR